MIPVDTSHDFEPTTSAPPPLLYHETHADGSFLIALGDWAATFYAGPGCDPDRIDMADVLAVAAYMAGYDATQTTLTFAETLRNATQSSTRPS